MKDISHYLSEALKNLTKRIKRAKTKDLNYPFDKSILKEVVCVCDNDVNHPEFLKFFNEYTINLKQKILCSEIENDMNYNIETEQHDYCHSSSWITDIEDMYIYSYYEIIEENEISYSTLLNEALKISKRNKDDYMFGVINELIILIRKNKMQKNNIQGIVKEVQNG